MVTIITSPEMFQQQLNDAGDQLVVVDFWAEWCGPCKKIGPYYANLARNTKNAVFLKVDVDKVPELVNQYQIDSLPTFKFFRKGQEIEKTQLNGADQEVLWQRITENLKSGE